MNYAFLAKNFRSFSTEEKIVFFGNLITVLSCFLPWFTADPMYGESFFYSAFGGPGALVGIFIFLISIFSVAVMSDRLFGSKKTKFLKKYTSETNFFIFSGVQQVIFCVISWSILVFVSREFEDAQIRFGVFVAILSQVSALTAAILTKKNELEKQTKSFFHSPETQKK